MILFWIFLSLSALGLLGALAALSRVLGYFRPRPPQESGTIRPLSALVPLKGVDGRTGDHLRALVESQMDWPVEFLFAVEDESDPAFALCQQIQQEYPNREIQIVISGPAGGRMGKTHNLAAALGQARYDWIASMDGDVAPEPDSLQIGLDLLNQPRAGAAFSLPYYGESDAAGVPAGGALVALYTNYFFFLYIGSLAIGEAIPLTVGSLWWISRATLEQIGGFDAFTDTVSDDAAIGKAVAQAGLRNLPVHRPARLAFEPLGFWAGFRHLQKWVAMLRSEGLLNYLLIFLSWHFVWFGLLAAIAGWLLDPQRLGWLGLIWLAVCAAARAASVLALNRRIFRSLPPTRFAVSVILYELLLVPLLFGIGLFKRTLIWRGRTYRIGRNGKILTE